jgi:hypothetical protein
MLVSTVFLLTTEEKTLDSVRVRTGSRRGINNARRPAVELVFWEERLLLLPFWG